MLTDLRQLIEQSRQAAAAAVNVGLTLMYWHIGQRIRTEVLTGRRTNYGEEIVSTVSRQLTADYGRSFSAKSLRHMIRIAEVFPSLEIVSTLSRQLAWCHFLELIYLKDPLARDFYTEMCSIERRSMRTKETGDNVSVPVLRPNHHLINFLRYIARPFNAICNCPSIFRFAFWMSFDGVQCLTRLRRI